MANQSYAQNDPSCTNCDGGKGCCLIGQVEREKNSLSFEDKQKAFFAAKKAHEAAKAQSSTVDADIVKIGSKRPSKFQTDIDDLGQGEEDPENDKNKNIFNNDNNKIEELKSTLKNSEYKEASVTNTLPGIEPLKFTFTTNASTTDTQKLDTYHYWKKGQERNPADSTVANLAAQKAAEDAAKSSFFAHRDQANRSAESKAVEEGRVTKEVLKAEWERRLEDLRREEEKKKIKANQTSTTMDRVDSKVSQEGPKSIFIPQPASFSALKGESPELKAKTERSNALTANKNIAERREDLSSRAKQSQSRSFSPRTSPARRGGRAQVARRAGSRLRPDTTRRIRALQNRLGRKFSGLDGRTIDPVLRAANRAFSRKTAERIVLNRNIERNSEGVRKNARAALIDKLTNPADGTTKRMISKTSFSADSLASREQNREVATRQMRARQNGATQEANRLATGRANDQSVRMTQALNQSRAAGEAAAMASRDATRISQEQVQRNVQSQLIEQQARIIQQNRLAMDAARLNQILQANRNATRINSSQLNNRTKIVDLNPQIRVQNHLKDKVPIIAKKDAPLNQKPVFSPQEKLLRAAQALDILQSRLSPKTAVIDLNQTLRKIDTKLTSVKESLQILERQKVSPELKQEVRKLIFDMNAYLKSLRDQPKVLQPNQNLSALELQRRIMIEVNRLEDKNIKDALMNELLKKTQNERGAESELDRVTSLSELLGKVSKFRAIGDFQRKLKELERKFKFEATAPVEDAPTASASKGAKSKQASNKRKEGSGPKAELVTDLVEVMSDGNSEEYFE